MLVALRFKPVNAAADINDSLAAGHESAADVGADGVVGALKLGGTADVVIGHGKAQRRNAHFVEDGAKGVVAEAVGVPLGNDDDGLLGARWVLVFGGGVPAGIHQIVFRVRRALRGCEAQVPGLSELSLGGFLAEGGVLGQGLGTNIGGKQFRIALFEAVISGRFVAEELVAVTDEELVDADHSGFGGGFVTQHLRTRQGRAQAVALKKGGDPLKAPLERTHDTVLVTRGQPRFPLVHPARVPFFNHRYSSILSVWDGRNLRSLESEVRRAPFRAPWTLPLRPAIRG
jgi:hypothetical protein